MWPQDSRSRWMGSPAPGATNFFCDDSRSLCSHQSFGYAKVFYLGIAAYRLVRVLRPVMYHLVVGGVVPTTQLQQHS